MGFLQDARAVWRTLVIIITPLILLPLLMPGSSKEWRCCFVLALMAVYWITEALPLAVTALLPVLLLPLLGIMSSPQVCQVYFKDVIFLLLGGLVVAIAIEESNLHKRFALQLLLLLGVQPRQLLLGFMVSTSFLSMWITNTATTAMMTPIARALLARLFHAKREQRRHETRRLQENEAEYSWPMGTRQNEDVVLAVERGIKETEIFIGKDKTEASGTSDTQNHPDDGDDDNTIDDDDNDRAETIRLRPLHHHNNSTADSSSATATTNKNNTDIIDNEIRDAAHSTRADVNGSDAESDFDIDDGDDAVSLNMDNLDGWSANLVKALCLGVCYSANIGGVGTLTGTLPNIVFKNYLESLSKGEATVSFVSWMVFGLPVAVVCLLLSWLWLQLHFFGVGATLLCRRHTSLKEDKALEDFLRREKERLGPMTFAEKVVLGHFLALVALWLTRAPGFITGWSHFFPKGYVSDAVPAVLVALSLFVFPRQRPDIFGCQGDSQSDEYVSAPSIVQWGPLSKKFPWGVLLLLGGGFALAQATQTSGLSALIADQLMVIGTLPAWAAGVVVVVVTSITTEFISNTVVATLLLPILAQVAASMGIHPVYFMLTSAVTSSFAFMLPVATPPNAIVFAHGDVKVLDMIKVGTMLNIVCMTVVTVAINTFGYAYFDLGHVPDWATRLMMTQATPTEPPNSIETILSADWWNHSTSVVPGLFSVSTVHS